MALQVPALPYAAAYAPYAYNALPAQTVVQAAPVKVATPQVYAAPVAPAPAIPYAPSSQFQAQDEFGNLNYGYSNINSQKHEIGNAYGGVTGKYSYVDANGKLQVVNYIADAAGFRVQATNLPVAPEAPAVEALEAPVFTGVAPAPVAKTAEVLEAEAQFFEKFEEAKNRNKRSAILPYASALPYAYGNYAYAGLPYANAYAYAAPALASTATYSTLEPVVAKTPAATIKTVPVQKTVTVPVAAPAVAYAAPAVAAPAVAAPAVAYAAPAAAGIESTLETVKLNPGHAVAYRVY